MSYVVCFVFFINNWIANCYFRSNICFPAFFPMFISIFSFLFVIKLNGNRYFLFFLLNNQTNWSNNKSILVMIYQDSLERDCRKYHNFSANLQRDFEMFCRDYFYTCPFSIDSIRFTKWKLIMSLNATKNINKVSVKTIYDYVRDMRCW